MSNDLLLLFERPFEPVFTAKGEDNKKIFEVPEEYLSKSDQELYLRYNVQDRFGDENPPDFIPLAKIAIPNLSLAKSLGKKEKFSVFSPLHMDMAAQVIRYLLGRNEKEFAAAAVYCKANLNPELFNYVYSVVMLHRPETQDIELYSHSELFPDKFFEDDAIFRARGEVAVPKDTVDRVTVDIEKDFTTATNVDLEHRLAYFREDVGVNLHHWHWHLVYPLSPVEVANKDRRGELFFYMHQQIIARYNMERFCNQLNRVKRLVNLRDPIEEAYYSKLSSTMASRNWPGRGSNMVLQDVSRPGLFCDINDLERWRDRIYDAIHQGYIITKTGEQLQLTEKDGIDILGNIMEASSLSKNGSYYGNFHNMMHVAVACIHDPDNRNLEPFGVMGDLATALRDPLFYRVHGMVDDMFQTYKATLKPYSDDDLGFSGFGGVTVDDLSVQVEGKDKNQLYTFWKQSEVNISRGLDFTQKGAIFIKFTHLQHEPFKYHITVTRTGSNVRANVRLFIAPKFDERGGTMNFNEQRKFFVELDRFTTDLKEGVNTIEQESEKSSVTIPFEQTYRDLDKKRSRDGDKFDFCGCGWPHNLLIAKGTETGFPCELFVMITNYDTDKVVEEGADGQCSRAKSYCGVRSKKYPDARPMGFPFDRIALQEYPTLQDFLLSNMKTVDVKIFHESRTVPSDE